MQDVPTLSLGEESETVRALQCQLCHIGYCDIDGPVHADGRFGNRTLRAIEAFQYDYGLIVDGVVGPQTWRALRHASKALRRMSR